MAKHKATDPATASVPAPAPAKVEKIPAKYAETLVAKGLLSREQVDAMKTAGEITAGGGSGTPAVENLIVTGMEKADAETLENLRKAYNAKQKEGKSLWRLRFVVQEMKAKEVEE